jgi:hypothetical protein
MLGATLAAGIGYPSAFFATSVALLGTFAAAMTVIRHKVSR